MQTTLSVKVGNKTVVSKPFDFEAMCIIDDAYNSGKNGALNFCRDAVDYMFEGTEVTQEVIEKLDLSVRVRLCNELWKLYIDIRTEAAKNG